MVIQDLQSLVDTGELVEAEFVVAVAVALIRTVEIRLGDEDVLEFGGVVNHAGSLPIWSVKLSLWIHRSYGGSMSIAVEMGSNGRIVIPAAMRRSLGVTAAGATFLADIVDGKIVLTAAAVVPRDEYDWLHSERVSQLLEGADDDVAQGRLHPLTRKHIATARADRTDDAESSNA